MQTISNSFSLLWAAMFLENKAYVAMRDNKSPVKKGLIILILLGLALALAGIIGTTLAWASSPSLDAIQQIILDAYKQAPWWQFIGGQPEAAAMFEQIWDQAWQIAGIFSPSPASSLVGLLAKPLGLILNWLIIGLLLYIVARILGGTGSLGQTYGTTALAFAPQLLMLLTALPFVTIVGISAWTLLCAYTAIKIAHNLSWGRTLWTLILAFAALIVVAMILGITFGIIFGSIFASVFAGGF